MEHPSDCVRLIRRQLAGLCLAMAVPSLALAGGPAGLLLASPLPDQVDGLIVKYRSQASPAAMDANQLLRSARDAAGRRGAKLQPLRRTALGAHVLRLDRRMALTEVEQIASDLAHGDFNVEYAEADATLHAAFTPNDPSFGSQWDLYEYTAGIAATDAWDLATGAGVVVAVVDTGYRPHADLASNLVAGYDFISDAFAARDGDGRDADAMDPGTYSSANQCGSGWVGRPSSWHGTHVSGTIAATTHNAQGVAGIAFNAKVQPLRVLGPCGGSLADIADAIVWASGGAVPGLAPNPTPARVVNLSLGGSGGCSNTFQNAIHTARSRGTVIVAAAGNSNSDVANTQPANCNGVVAVAAMGRAGGRASYSNYGSLIDIAAPGGDGSDGILSTLNTGTTGPGSDSYGSYVGTSMAAPHVSGVAALMLSMNSAMTPDDVESLLRWSSRPFPVSCSLCGQGILQARTAVFNARQVVDSEPNDTLATAQLIDQQWARIKGNFADTGATGGPEIDDYFSIVVPAGATLTASFEPGSDEIVSFTLINAQGGRIGATCDPAVVANGYEGPIACSWANPGTAALVYVALDHITGPNGNYTLEIAVK